MNFLPVNLPSKCVTYGVKPEDIKLRTYIGSDELLLAQVNPVNLEKTYLLVLQNVIQGIDPKKLTLGDRLYIMLWEYINSYSNTIKMDNVCSNCLESVEISIDLSSLEKVYLPDSYKEPYMESLSTGKIGLRLLTIEDEIEVDKFSDKKEAPLYRLARSIVSKDDVLKRLEMIRNMPAKDVATIRAFHERMFHGPDMHTKVTCPKCGSEEEIEVPFRFEFIFPNGKTLTDTFGKRV